MRKQLVSIVLSAALAAGLTACSSPSPTAETTAAGNTAAETEAEAKAEAPAKGTYTLNIGSPLSATHPTTIAFQSFKEAVEERTNGDLVVNIYTDSALGGESDLLEQVTSGTTEGMLQGGAANWEPYNAEVNVALLPFLFTSIDNARAAWGGQFGDEFCEKLLAPTGVTVLSVWEQGYRHMTNNTRPIVEPSDVAGIKFRTNENSMKVSMYEAAGGSAVIMSFSDVYTGLQNKTIDGQENPLSTIYTSSLYDVQKYLSLTGHMYDAAPFAVNTEWYTSLPEEYQTILKEEAVNAREIVFEENDETKYLAQLKEAGMEVNEVNKEAFQKAMTPVWDKYAAGFENGQYWIDLATSFNK